MKKIAGVLITVLTMLLAAGAGHRWI